MCYRIFTISLLCSFCYLKVHAQSTERRLTLDNVIDTLSLSSPSAIIEKLNFQNALLQFENYNKSLLPSFSINLNPININRSLIVLQEPATGVYSYVEDYSNNSSLGVSLNQKIGLTGGNLTVGSRLNYLNEFSVNKHSYSTVPFVI